MADYYTKLCYNLPFQGDQQTTFLTLVDRRYSIEFQKHLDDRKIEHTKGESYCDFEPIGEFVIVTAEEQVNLEVLCEIIRMTLEAHDDDRALGFEYSLDTNAPASDGCYGGGFAIITRDAFEVISTHEQLQARLKSAALVEG